MNPAEVSVDTTTDSADGQEASPTLRLNAARANLGAPSGSEAATSVGIGAMYSGSQVHRSGMELRDQQPGQRNPSPTSGLMFSSQDQLPGIGSPSQFGSTNGWQLAADVVKPQPRFGASVGRGKGVGFTSNALLSPPRIGMKPLRSVPTRIGQSAQTSSATQTSGPSKIQLGAHRAKMQVPSS